VVNHALHECHVLYVINEIETSNQILHMHPRVDLPDGSYTFVLEGGDEELTRTCTISL
jgi:hypothetical protein